MSNAPVHIPCQLTKGNGMIIYTDNPDSAMITTCTYGGEHSVELSHDARRVAALALCPDLKDFLERVRDELHTRVDELECAQSAMAPETMLRLCDMTRQTLGEWRPIIEVMPHKPIEVCDVKTGCRRIHEQGVTGEHALKITKGSWTHFRKVYLPPLPKCEA